MNATAWHVSVIIPARNEEQLIARCLQSVFAAEQILPPRVTFDLVVAVDSSTDRTASIAEQMIRGRGVVMRTDAGSVGAARALAAGAALQRYKGPYERCWFANTDADCIVPPTWLTDQLLLAESDIHAVAGTVDVDTFEEHLPIVKDRFRATYPIRPDGTHPNVHGANIGFRADFYLRAGGWGNLLTGEDHDLWGRLSEVAAARLSPACLQVLTSGRRVGRAPHGFAEALAAHNETVA